MEIPQVIFGCVVGERERVKQVLSLQSCTQPFSGPSCRSISATGDDAGLHPDLVLLLGAPCAEYGCSHSLHSSPSAHPGR